MSSAASNLASPSSSSSSSWSSYLASPSSINSAAQQFRESAASVYSSLPNGTALAQHLPSARTSLIVGGCVAACALTGPAAVNSLLYCGGFTSAGVAPSSVASAWMSSIALSNGVGVASGSVYAGLQSIAMTGAYSTVSSAVGAVGGAAGGALLSRPSSGL